MVVVSSTFDAPADGVLLQTPSTKLLINDQEIGTGTLYITQDNVVWGGGVSATGGPSPSITLLYPTISLHAIQREPSAALYMVLNYELRVAEMSPPQHGDGDGSDDDDYFDPDNQPITQLRFVPQSEAELQGMYSAMSQGQALHPDPADEEDDDDYMDGEEFDEGDEEFEDAEESTAPPEDAAARFRQLRLDSNTNGTHVFEDAEDVWIGEE